MFTIRFLSLPSIKLPWIKPRFAVAIVFAALVSLALTAPGSSVAAEKKFNAAEKIGAADRKAIEQVIRDQLDAFGRDDARGAFAHASPDIQRMFGTPEKFLRMVREHYEPVYRAGSIRFVRLEAIDRQWVQTVQLVDEEGHVWRALFTMKRQADKIWRVGGCQLVSTDAITT